MADIWKQNIILGYQTASVLVYLRSVDTFLVTNNPGFGICQDYNISLSFIIHCQIR